MRMSNTDLFVKVNRTKAVINASFSSVDDIMLIPPDSSDHCQIPTICKQRWWKVGRMRLWFEFGTCPLILSYHCTDNNFKDIKWHDFTRNIEKRLDSKLWFGF